MADEGPQPPGFFSALIALGKSIVDLVHAVKQKQPPGTAGEALSSQEPSPQRALPAPAEHFETAQLLTQHTPGWHKPNPASLAAPSYAPAMTAFAIVFIALGAVTRWPVSVIGAFIFVVAIGKWIGELLHD